MQKEGRCGKNTSVLRVAKANRGKDAVMLGSEVGGQAVCSAGGYWVGVWTGWGIGTPHWASLASKKGHADLRNPHVLFVCQRDSSRNENNASVAEAEPRERNAASVVGVPLSRVLLPDLSLPSALDASALYILVLRPLILTLMVIVEQNQDHTLATRSAPALPMSSSTKTDVTVNDQKLDSPTDLDIERATTYSPTTLPTVPVDPYSLREGIKGDDELSEIRKRRKNGKKLEKFHRRQNNLINSLLKSMEEHTEEARVEEEASRLPVKIAIWASLLANLSLCVLQMYAAISSLSLSLLATGIDSVFDIGSNITLFWLHKKATRLDLNKWPVGGSRLETIGNVVYGFLMGSVNLVVIVESARTLVSHNDAEELNEFHVPSIVAVGAALGVKVLLFLYCLTLRKASSQVEVLWEDHRNDLFINGFGILMSAGGSKIRWYLDPMGAIIIAAGVILSWTRTVWKQFELLAGKSAPHDFLQLIIYKATTFSDEIGGVDTVRAYHSGPVRIHFILLPYS
ncbi:hypothetical protein QCA50_002284 [Cerrena zonata]|uniref:Cation efflux protein transmembrane domain-containing protein n=1 Tax=Cerrena zonata TaxID=2478898 RepID=A0AAW0GZ23_9APHY